MSFIVIGFYTKDTPYEKEIQGLIKSCNNFNIPCEVRGYDQRGSWQDNTCIKPEFILDMMYEHPDKDLLYIDADGIIQKYPTLFDAFDGDIGVHFRNGSELLSGTIYIKNSDKMIMFIKCWINVISNYRQLTDQQALAFTIKKYAKSQDVKVIDLPATYTQIFDLMKDAGEPVIEHFQASRRFKQSVNVCVTIPEFIAGMKTRLAGDGSFFLPRANPEIEEMLRKDYVKLEGELRWYPKQSEGKNLAEMQPYFANKECYIVGKGPSLDNLSASDFSNPRLPVLCINECIHKVESLKIPNKVYAMQQDAWLKDTCRPTYGGIILSYACRYWYPDIEDKYIFHYSQLGLSTNNITVVYALALAKKLNCTGFRMLCFDSCVTNSVEYGKCIGYDSARGGSKKRFLSHKKTILEYAHPLPIRFIIPKGPASRVVYKPQQ